MTTSSNETAEAQAPAFTPNEKALDGAWKYGNINGMASLPNEERLFAMPYGAEHFFHMCSNIDVLVKIDVLLERAGRRPVEGLVKLRRGNVLIVQPPGARTISDENWFVSVSAVKDLKKYALNLANERLYRIRFYCKAPYLQNNIVPQTSIVVRADSQGDKILGILDNFDTPASVFEPVSYLHTMAVCNLLHLVHRSRMRVDEKLSPLLITGALGPEDYWITDVRIPTNNNLDGLRDETYQVVKFVEGANNGVFDILLFILRGEDEVVEHYRYDKLLPYVHDAVASLAHAFLTHSGGPLEEIQAKLQAIRIMAVQAQDGPTGSSSNPPAAE